MFRSLSSLTCLLVAMTTPQLARGAEEWTPDFACPMDHVPVVKARQDSDCDNTLCQLKAKRVGHGNDLVEQYAGQINQIIDEYNTICRQVEVACETEKNPQCSDGEKKDIKATFVGDVPGANEGGELWATLNISNVNSIDELINLFKEELREPIDPKGICRDCVQNLGLLQHGGRGDSLKGEYRFGEHIVSIHSDVDKESLTLKRKTRIQRDMLQSLSRIRPYLCKTAKIWFYQCNVARNEEGRMTGTALANFFGVSILAPDVTTYVGFGGECVTTFSDSGTLWDEFVYGDGGGYRTFNPLPGYELKTTCEEQRHSLIQTYTQKLVPYRQPYNSAVANLPYLAEELAECEREYCGDPSKSAVAPAAASEVGEAVEQRDDKSVGKTTFGGWMLGVGGSVGFMRTGLFDRWREEGMEALNRTDGFNTDETSSYMALELLARRKLETGVIVAGGRMLLGAGFDAQFDEPVEGGRLSNVVNADIDGYGLTLAYERPINEAWSWRAGADVTHFRLKETGRVIFTRDGAVVSDQQFSEKDSDTAIGGFAGVSRRFNDKFRWGIELRIQPSVFRGESLNEIQFTFEVVPK